MPKEQPKKNSAHRTFDVIKSPRDIELDEIKQKIADDDAAQLADEIRRQKGRARQKRFTSLVGPWFKTWDSRLVTLKASRTMLSKEQQSQLDLLVKAFKKAGDELSNFITSCHADMTKKT